MSTNNDKTSLRKHIREIKRQYPDKQLEEMSLPIVERLLAHPAVIEARIILMYYSLPDEVDTHNTVEQLRRQGKTVLLPRVVDDGRMEIRMYETPDDLVKGHYGIMGSSAVQVYVLK